MAPWPLRCARSWRGFVIALWGLVALVVAPVSAAAAWVELTVSNDDIAVTIDDGGKAIVEHKVTLLVSGGPLHDVTIRGVDADAVVMPDGYVAFDKTASKGSHNKKDSAPEGPLPITAERIAVPAADGAPARTDLKITLAPGEGIRRGVYTLLVRYRTDLEASGALGTDGATSLLRWTGPAWDDGLDATKATFEVPAAPMPPKAVEPDDESENENATVLSELHRGGRTDVIELTRPYAPKGERVVWTIRTDPRAFGQHGAEATPKPAPPAPKLRGMLRPRDGLAIGLGLALFALIAGLVAAKSVEVARLARERRGVARPLVPLPVAVRASIAGALFVGGLYVEATQTSSTWGALMIASVALFAVQRSPRVKSTLRGPGQWLYVSAQEALRTSPISPRAWLDASTWRGRFGLFVLVGFAAVASLLLWPSSRYYAVLAALDVAPLFAIFFTGRLDQLAPDPASRPIALFRRVVRLVQRAAPGVRVAPRVRVPAGGSDADELRVAFVPEKAARGLLAVELAAGYATGLGGYVVFPEICVRFQAGTPCEERAQRLTEPGRIQRGRRPNERVLVLSPKIPWAGMTAELVIAVLQALSGDSATQAPPSVKPRSRAKPPLAA